MALLIRNQLSRTSEEEQQRLRDLVKKISGPAVPRSVWFIAEDQGEIGCAFVVLFEDFITVDYLYVEPSWRNHSVGRSLISAIADYAMANGKSRLLASTRGRFENLGFWQKCGFVLIGSSRGTTESHDVHYLEKRIPSSSK